MLALLSFTTVTSYDPYHILAKSDCEDVKMLLILDFLAIFDVVRRGFFLRGQIALILGQTRELLQEFGGGVVAEQRGSRRRQS